MKKAMGEFICALLGVFLLVPAFAVGFVCWYLVEGFREGMEYSSGVFDRIIKEEKKEVA